jgi:hypothetical protein
MRPTIRRLFLLTVGATIAAPVSPAAANHLEAKMYAMTKWDGGCSGSQRDWWDDMAYGWYDEIADSSWYNHAGKAVNGNIQNLWFSDSSLVSGATDSAHIDGADAAIIAWHGGDSSGVWQGSMRVPGGGSNSCKSRSDEMLLGNSDLEFAVLSSCHSMDDNMWSSWRKSFGGMHQADGFHGLMWISSGRVDDYEDFADDGFDEAMSYAWMDDLYDSDVKDGYAQCPVAYSVGSSSSDVLNRLTTERYDFIFSDPSSNNYWAAMYIKGCLPKGETTIGSDKSS